MATEPAPAAKQHFIVDDELKKLPKQPGVYIMHDAQDTILYVGKAKNLHNRVRSYFQKKIVGRGPQIESMVRQVAYFEYIVSAASHGASDEKGQSKVFRAFHKR